MSTLAGRSAVVTGGGRGIGASVARALAEAGAGVLVAARSTNEIERVAAELSALGHRVLAVPCDVTDPDSVRKLAVAAANHLGTVDVLVNNAGIAHSAPLHRLTLEDWNRLLAVNATGTMLCTQAFMPGMIDRQWGRVVNIASIAGLSGAKYISAYSAAKHAVVGFTRALAAEVAAHGVTVNAVCPGYVDTPMTDQSLSRISEKTGKSRQEALAAILSTTPQGRLITPDEVAHAVTWLCADSARGVNGQTIVIDGGSLLA